MIRILVIAATAAFCIGLPFNASASTPEERSARNLQSVAEYQQARAQAEAVLQAKPSSEWTQQEVEDYQFPTLCAAYWAIEAFKSLNDRLPAGEEELKSSGMLEPWPGNPLRDWEPIRLAPPSPDFAPGELVLQTCPLERYKGLTGHWTQAYVLSINGSAPDYQPLDPAKSFPFPYVSFDWASILPGTAFLTGAFVDNYCCTIQNMRDYQTDLRRAGMNLRAKNQADWTEGEVESYLQASFYTIYFALITFVNDRDRHPASWQELYASGILDPWPGNPWRGWQPINWDDGAGGFAPGDMVVQLCPPEMYSRLDPRPLTFVISIYGPAPDYAPANPKSLAVPESWATIPAGSAFASGAHWEPTEKTRAKVEASQEARAKAAEEAGEAGVEPEPGTLPAMPGGRAVPTPEE